MNFTVETMSIDCEPSRTAMAAATLRALAANDESIKGPDSLAELFLPEELREVLKDPVARDRAFSNRIIPGMYEFMIARTAFFDEIVTKAFLDEMPQVVFLGAGYDSRSCRFSGLLGSTRIFELDAGPTQLRKKEVLKKAGIKVPGHVAYVPVNFITEDFIDVLGQAGFNSGIRTLFVWEGVTYYLDRQVIDHTLKAIKSNSPAGSSVCFDYASVRPSPPGQTVAGNLSETSKSRYSSEPVKFALKQGAIGPFLSSRGFKLLRHLDSEEMEMIYLPMSRPAGNVPDVFCLVHASA